MKDLLSLTSRLAGLAIVNPVVDSANQYNCSWKVTATIINLLNHQAKDYPCEAFCNQIEAKKFKRWGERHKHCSPLNYLQSSQIHLSVLLKLKRKKKLQIGLLLFQFLNIVLPYTKEPLQMPSVCDTYDIPSSYLPTLSVTNNLWSIMHKVSPLGGGSFHLTQQGQGHHAPPT